MSRIGAVDAGLALSTRLEQLEHDVDPLLLDDEVDELVFLQAEAVVVGLASGERPLQRPGHEPAGGRDVVRLEEHGGEMAFTGEPGGGTRVTMRFARDPLAEITHLVHPGATGAEAAE